jgi:integrase
MRIDRTSSPESVSASRSASADLHGPPVLRDPGAGALRRGPRPHDLDRPPPDLWLGPTRHSGRDKDRRVCGPHPLPPFVIDRVAAHLERQDALRPIVPIGDSLVFVTADGLAINGSWFTKHFQALLRRAGLPAMRLHDMRHGAASLLVDAGAHPRVIQELLRHATASKETMDRYAHVTSLQQRDAAERLERLLTSRESVTQSVTEALDGVAKVCRKSP